MIILKDNIIEAIVFFARTWFKINFFIQNNNIMNLLMYKKNI